jgi:hypothetical protein
VQGTCSFKLIVSHFNFREKNRPQIDKQQADKSMGFENTFANTDVLTSRSFFGSFTFFLLAVASAAVAAVFFMGEE